MRFLFNRLLFVTLCLYTSMLIAQPRQDSTTCSTHSCCCSYDPTPSGVMISHLHSKKEWMLSYRYMNMNMSGLQNGQTSINSDEVFATYLMSSEAMRMDMHMLMAMYGVSHKLTVMGMLNYNHLSMQMSMLPVSGGHHHGGNTNASHSMEVSGLGDIKLYVLYGILNKNNQQIIASGGVSIPTGNYQVTGTEDDMMYPDKRLPYGMQLGSGSVEIMPGITYLYQKEKLTYSAQAHSVLRTGNNSIGYKWGNEYTLNMWTAYKWLGFLSSSVRAEATHTDKISGADPSVYFYNEPSANPNNYGGNRVNIYIGSILQIKKVLPGNNRIGIEYGIPVYQDVNGLQMSTHHTIYASWSVGF